MPGARPGKYGNVGEIGGERRATPRRDRSLGGDHAFLVLLSVGVIFLVVLFGKESGKRFIAAVLIGRCGGAVAIGTGQAQRLGQPAGVGQQTFGLLGHVALLHVVDELRGPLAGGLADGLHDAGLGDAAEIIADRRPPSDLRHVEARRPRQSVGLCEADLQPVLADTGAAIGIGPFVERVDAIADAMGEQLHAIVVVERDEPIPQRLVIGRNMVAPAIMPVGDGFAEGLSFNSSACAAK